MKEKSRDKYKYRRAAGKQIQQRQRQIPVHINHSVPKDNHQDGNAPQVVEFQIALFQAFNLSLRPPEAPTSETLTEYI